MQQYPTCGEQPEAMFVSAAPDPLGPESVVLDHACGAGASGDIMPARLSGVPRLGRITVGDALRSIRIPRRSRGISPRGEALWT